MTSKRFTEDVPDEQLKPKNSLLRNFEETGASDILHQSRKTNQMN